MSAPTLPPGPTHGTQHTELAERADRKVTHMDIIATIAVAIMLACMIAGLALLP